MFLSGRNTRYGVCGIHNVITAVITTQLIDNAPVDLVGVYKIVSIKTNQSVSLYA
jgi:hypothetical protein